MAILLFGSPGSGKTTVATSLSLRYKGKVFTNISGITGKNVVSVSDDDIKRLGEWSPPSGSLIVVDEASVIFNNRHWKKFPEKLIQYIKLHRHYKVDLVFVSQSFNDVDCTITRLIDSFFYIQRRGPFSLYSRVLKRVKVDKETEQIIDGYRIVSPLWLILKPLKIFMLHKLFPQVDYHRFCFRPFWYKHFDSYYKPDLPDLQSFRQSEMEKNMPLDLK